MGPFAFKNLIIHRYCDSDCFSQLTAFFIVKGTERVASDGRKYRWLGGQWGRIAKSGKTSHMARKAIGAELTHNVRRGLPSKKLKVKKSVAWFKRKVGESARGFKRKGKLAPGKMYTFGYDAKFKEILPYWDKFPLQFKVCDLNAAPSYTNPIC